ncbi:MAG: electron transfer flavoprotein subunit alpha/FixB family protein [Spirochaetales bacterium]|nr:electron transfer flavoprotein subunit alpha/FixB family protein [Spirochaetales bacterium]
MGLVIHREKVTAQLGEKLKALCPFGAIGYSEKEGLSIGMGCKVCRLCVKKGEGAVTFEEETAPGVNKDEWKGILVFCDHFHGKIHNVTFELLGKARELASVTGQKVMALMIGSGIAERAEELYCYGADEVYVYDHEKLNDFLIEPYANVFYSFIQEIRPSSILVGATNVGRSLAPRVAARLKTGLTADCTSLEMTKDTDLVQIRPAFGGNIMARIMTPNNRPQFCTVRYKIFSKPERKDCRRAATIMKVTPEMLKSGEEILDVEMKPEDVDISEAEILVQCGRGVKSKADLAMVQEFASLIGARMACTRPLVENNWFDAKHQIGLSGRTVKPKLLVCVGVSGAVQTVAGMKGSDLIVAINSDPTAPIFDVAHYGFVGDLYEIIPMLIERIKGGRADVQ